MKTRSLAAALLLLTCTSSKALAAATADQASAIKSKLQAYVGAEPGVVEVVPQGDDYLITLDATPLLKKIDAAGFTATFSAWKIVASPAAAGTWNVSSTGPVDMAFAMGGAMSTEMHAANTDWKGTFDEALGGFTSSQYKYTGITLSQSQDDPQTKVKTKGAYGIESLEGTNAMAGSGDGIVDAETSMTLKGITNASSAEMPADMQAAGMANFSYAATGAQATYTSKGKGFRYRALLDLLAWFVAHPEKERIQADQAQLRGKLAAALPVFENLTSSGSIDTLAITSGFGNVTLNSLGSGLDMNGAVKEGKFGENFSIKGLTIPAGLAPPWATDLVPTDIGFNVSVSGFDAETPARLALQDIDFTKDPPLPPETGNKLLASFAPTNAVIVTLAPSEIKAPAFALAYDGAFNVNFAGLPTGKANFKMTGFDAVLQKVQAAAATDPNAQQAISMLVAAKGLGKAEPDGAMTWAVEMLDGGKVTVNGMDMSTLGAPQ